MLTQDTGMHKNKGIPTQNLPGFLVWSSWQSTCLRTRKHICSIEYNQKVFFICSKETPYNIYIYWESWPYQKREPQIKMLSVWLVFSLSEHLWDSNGIIMETIDFHDLHSIFKHQVF